MEPGTDSAVGRTLLSNNTSSQLKSPGFTAFFVILTLLACAAVLLNILTIAALLKDSTILKTIRALLVNILVAELLTGAAILMDTIGSAILTASVTSYSTPPRKFCRFVNWIFAASVVARMYGLVAYIAAVIVYNKWGWSMVKTVYMSLSIAALWTAALVLGVDRWIPQSVDATFIQDVTCSSVMHRKAILSVRLSFGILWIILGGFLPIIVCFALTFVAIFQLGTKNMQNNLAVARYKKSVAKLASFLIIGNFVNLLCICLPSLGSIIASFPKTQVDSIAVVTIFFSSLTLSLFPTHIIVIIFMKTVRQQMTVIICYCRHHCRQKEGVTDELEMKDVPLLVEEQESNFSPSTTV